MRGSHKAKKLAKLQAESETRTTQTVQIGPRNWRENLPLLLAILESGSADGRKYARDELHRMAHVADMFVEQGRRKA